MLKENFYNHGVSLGLCSNKINVINVKSLCFVLTLRLLEKNVHFFSLRQIDSSRSFLFKNLFLP